MIRTLLLAAGAIFVGKKLYDATRQDFGAPAAPVGGGTVYTPAGTDAARPKRASTGTRSPLHAPEPAPVPPREREAYRPVGAPAPSDPIDA